jgi:uncharacterized protein (TIGR02001 family)
MKALKLAICAATASLALGGTAYAQDVTFNVGVASDYVFRGISQTDEGPQVFGGVDVSKDIFYAGVWASNIDFGDGTDAEIDAYVGVKPVVGSVTLDFAAIYYGYVGEPGGADWAQWEFKAAASVPAGPVTLGAAAYYTPDYTGVGTDDGLYVELNASFSPAEKWTIGGAVGSQEVDTVLGSVDYQTWNVGIGYAFTDKVSADLRYHDGNLDCGNLCDSRAVLTFKAVLP